MNTTAPARSCAVLCVLAILASASAAQAREAAFYTLFSDQAIGMSGDGNTVVGGYESFRWKPPLEKQSLGEEFPQSFAFSASYDGSVVVGDSREFGTPRAYRWTESTGYQFLDATGPQATGEDISADGSVIVGTIGGFDGRAYRWTETTGIVPLSALPSNPGELQGSSGLGVSGDGRVVVGHSRLNGSERLAVRWVDGVIESLGDLPGGGIDSIGWGVSADGSVIVGTGESSRGQEAFRWSETGGIQSLWPLISAYDVSADGSVVIGAGSLDGGPGEPLLWDPVNGARSLYDLLVERLPEVEGWHLGQAESISDDGFVIVGQANAPNGGPNYSFMAIVPEPSSMVLLLLGAAGLIFVRFARWNIVR